MPGTPSFTTPERRRLGESRRGDYEGDLNYLGAMRGSLVLHTNLQGRFV